MFRIDSNQSLKMSKGDTVYFPLFLNKGTLRAPLRYGFSPIVIKFSEAESTITKDSVMIDEDTWISKVGDISGAYLFDYSTGSWELDGEDVSLIEYGITIIGEVSTSSYFTINYEYPDENEFVQFFILPINNRGDEPILVKEYHADGKIVSKRNDGKRTRVITTIGNNNVNVNGDMIIRLEADDTCYIPEGQYRYQIRARLKDVDDASGYSMNTVTNRLPFYVIDDDYSSNFIYR